MIEPRDKSTRSKNAARQQVEDALVEVLASPAPPLDELDRDVYATIRGR